MRKLILSRHPNYRCLQREILPNESHYWHYRGQGLRDPWGVPLGTHPVRRPPTSLRSGRPAYAERQAGEGDFSGGLASIAKPDDEKDTGASQHCSWRELPDTPCGFHSALPRCAQVLRPTLNTRTGEGDFFGGLASAAKPDDEKDTGASQHCLWRRIVCADPDYANQPGGLNNLCTILFPLIECVA